MTSSRLRSSVFALGALSLSLLGAAACNRGATKPASSVTATDSSMVVALIGSQPITLADLDHAAGRKLFEVREQALDQLITTKVLEEVAKKSGQSEQDYLRKQVEAKVPEVSVDEAKQFFEANKAQLGGGLGDKPFEEVKDIIVKGLTGQKRQGAVASVLEDLKQKAGVKVLLRAPKVQVAADGPSKGPKDAKVTIVEFSDFQCPYCNRGRQVIEEVLAKYPNNVRVVFRDFPLDFHDKAQKAAEAAHCAEDQSKFWPLHDFMFSNQDKLDVEGLKKAARDLGLDGNTFDNCLTSGKYAQVVAKNMKDGQTAGVTGTPAFFINGSFLNGAQPFEKFKAEIDKALAE
jgi:protein-disulfide isomerase